MAIPRLIHFIWYQGVTSAPEEVRVIPAKWERINPGWRVHLWDGVSLGRFIRTHYGQYFSAWNSLSSVIKKCDFARILLLFHFGGVYADMDLTPHTSLDAFLEAGEVRHRHTFATGRLPQPDPVERAPLADRELIFTREYRQVSDIGWPIANGIIFSKPHLNIWTDFLNSRLFYAHMEVLNYVGPWALTRFVKERIETLRGKATILPPYYFLWEQKHFDQPRPAWVVAEHGAKNYWGDHSKPDWWKVV